MSPPVRSYQAANTINVLEQLAAAPRSVPELADLVEVHPRTVRRIVGLLAAAEYVERVPDDPKRKRYRVAGRVRRLGHRLATANHQGCAFSQVDGGRAVIRGRGMP